MKAGSSSRCKSKREGGRYFAYRCHLTVGHKGPHQAPAGSDTIRWDGE